MPAYGDQGANFSPTQQRSRSPLTNPLIGLVIGVPLGIVIWAILLTPFLL